MDSLKITEVTPNLNVVDNNDLGTIKKKSDFALKTWIPQTL